MAMLEREECQVSKEKVGNGAERISENIAVELQDRHPTPGGHMNGANDHDIASPDASFPNAPPQVGIPGIWFTTLKTRMSVQGSAVVTEETRP